MGKPKADYRLYLVTDSSPAILGDGDVCQVVEAALQGGATCVQYREKNKDTGEMIEMARKLHAVTRRHKRPLLINDRLDVALAVGCEGVHIGQDDIKLSVARSLLGPDAIIGVTASTAEQAIEAAQGGADYLGVGTVYATPTKINAKHIIGPVGVRQIVHALHGANCHVPVVCIGGIAVNNVERVLFQAESGGQPQGVAVVSAIMAAPDPRAAAKQLLDLVSNMSSPSHVLRRKRGVVVQTTDEVLDAVPLVIRAVHEKKPLSHNMTNLVVQNFAANVALAIGASPIMANEGEEARELARLDGALVVNMGTVSPEGLDNYVKAIRAYNDARGPIVFDPVGAGATSIRRAAVGKIMSAGYLDVIKGNEGEIRTVLGHDDEQQRGVDSTSTLSDQAKVAAVQELATRVKAVVVMTGERDYVSDGNCTFRIDNGHELLGMVTGTGCALGTVISAAVAACPEECDVLSAVLAVMLHYEIAAEVAADRPEVRGPGTFVPAFLDELCAIRQATVRRDLEWLRKAKLMQCQP